MFYFAQKIKLKNQPGVFVFQCENDLELLFKNDNETVVFTKVDFKKEDVIELWETVQLFGKSNIKRLARAY